MPEELSKTSALVPLTDLEMGRLLRWARRIEDSEEFPIDELHISIVAKLERYSKGEK